MKCFKVVRTTSEVKGRSLKIRPKRLISVISPEPFRTTYKIGERVKAPDFLAEKGYHLLAFSNEQDAYHFVYRVWMSKGRVFEAEGTDLVISIPLFLDTSWWDNGWKKSNADDLLWMIDEHTVSDGWPKGTLMFKEITLLKELK